MRALILADRVGTTGGTRSFLLRLLDVHRANHVETAVLIAPHAVDDELSRRCREGGFRLYARPEPPRRFRRRRIYRGMLRDSLRLRGPLREFAPDLLIASNQRPGTGYAPFLLRTPLLFVMHTYPETRPRGSWIPARLAGPRRRILTVSHHAAREIHRHMGVPEEFIAVIHNSFAPPRAARAKRAGDGPVLTVGHVVGYKNPGIWLEVAERVIARRPGTRFVWLGDGDRLDEMRRAVRATGLEQSVELPGHSHAVQDAYERASVYFHPSLRESHGIAVLDAMAHGLPCVASNAGGILESVEDGTTGCLCDPRDVDGFAARILECLEDAGLADRLGAAGEERVNRLFSPRQQERRYLELLASLDIRARRP